MKRWAMIVGLISVTFVGSVAVAGEVIYNNFALPGDGYHIGGGWSVSGNTSSQNNDVDIAMAFTTPAGNDYTLDMIEVAFGLHGGTNACSVGFMDDVGGMPGAILESWDMRGVMGMLGIDNPLISVSSTLHPTLQAGGQYWVYASTRAENDDTVFYWNTSDDIGTKAVRSNMGFWSSKTDPLSAFRVTATPISVPAPSSCVLVGLGLMGLIARRRKKGG